MPLLKAVICRSTKQHQGKRIMIVICNSLFHTHDIFHRNTVMKDLFLNICRVAFYTGCVIAATLLTLGFLLEYQRNRQSFDVDLQRFNENAQGPYPSISMCFATPFQDKLVRNSGGRIDPYSYSEFLLGRSNDTSLFNMNYDKISLQLSDFLIDTRIFTKSIDNIQEEESIPLDRISSTSLNVYKWRFLKCFTFDFPFKEKLSFNGVLIQIKKDIFPNNSRPMDGWTNYLGLSFYFHYPNQLFSSYPSRKLMWPNEMMPAYTTMIYLSNIEILTGRNPSVMECINEPEYDKKIMTNIVSQVGCVPPYWNITGEFPSCQTQNQLSQISQVTWDNFFTNDRNLQPCTKVGKINAEFLDTKNSWNIMNDTDHLLFQVFFREQYFQKQTMKREYAAKTMFGDIGGVVGILLGYSLINMPGLIITFYSSFKSKAKKYLSALRLRWEWLNMVKESDNPINVVIVKNCARNLASPESDLARVFSTLEEMRQHFEKTLESLKATNDIQVKESRNISEELSILKKEISRQK